MMRPIVACVFLLLLSLPAFSQNKEKQIGIGAQPFYSGRIWTKSPGGSTVTDSLNNSDRGLAGINPQVWFFAFLNKNLTLQTGLSYTVYGFQRQSPDIPQGYQPHPDLPVMTDNLQGDPRYIDFIYRMHYIQVPVLFNMEMVSLRKSISVKYYFSPGISFGFKTYDKTIARTRGFGYDGKNRFTVNNLYETNPVNVQLHLGGRLEYRFSNKYRTHFQPVINLPVTSVFTGGNKAFVPSFGVNLVISIITSKIAESDN